MSENGKDVYLKLIEVASAEYMDKHHHYWSIYWRFLSGLAFVTGLYVFGEENLPLYTQADLVATTVIFCIVLTLIGIVSSRILIREHTFLLQIKERNKYLYQKIGIEPFPDVDSALLSKIERSLDENFSIASALSISILGITVLCIGLVLLSSCVIASSQA